MRARLATLPALLLALACSPLPFDPAGPDDAPDPSEPGPYPVGVRTIVIEDPDRIDKDTNQTRRLRTEIWYPAEESARGGPGTVHDLREVLDLSTVLTPEQQQRIAGIEIPTVSTTAVRDAPPRLDGRPFPLVLFGHGQGSIRWQSAFYTVALASHGYVVVAPDHAGSTLPDLIAARDLRAALSAIDRPLDFVFLLDWALSRPAGDWLHGLVDPEQIGLTGHSFGAYTALAVAPRDARVKAIVPQAPTAASLAWIGLQQPVVLNIPVLVQAGHLDDTLPWDGNVAPTWAALKRPRWLMDLVHGGHFSFSELCALDLTRVAEAVDFDVGDALRDGCAPPAPPAAVAKRVVNHFAIGFFNTTLRQSPDSAEWLTQAEADRLAAGEVRVEADP